MGSMVLGTRNQWMCARWFCSCRVHLYYWNPHGDRPLDIFVGLQWVEDRLIKIGIFLKSIILLQSDERKNIL